MKPPYSRSVRTRKNHSIPETWDTNERVQKVLAQLGMGSRRQIERWISDGRIKINGKLAQLGDRVRNTDRLMLDGRIVNLSGRIGISTRVLLYYKPTGEVVTRRDPGGRPVVFTQLPKLKMGRWITVGRLDINTQGLLLVTNNGDLANRLMHPANGLEREYAVRVLGRVSEAALARLLQGVSLDDGLARFDSITAGRGEGVNHWYRVTLTQGRNRIVRRLWESQGIKVSRLLRVRYGPVVLPDKLKARTFIELEDKERAALMACVDLKDDKTIRQPYTRRFNTTRRKKSNTV